MKKFLLTGCLALMVPMLMAQPPSAPPGGELRDRPPRADRPLPDDRPLRAERPLPADRPPENGAPPLQEPLDDADVVYPEENPFGEEKRVLGKILFWDEQLSSDNSTACGSCHQPASGGGDSRLALHPGPDGMFSTEDDTIGSPGIALYDSNMNPQEHPQFGFGPQVTARAAPSVLMAMYANQLFVDGRAGSEFRDPLSGELLISDNAALENQSLAPILNTSEMAKQGRTWDEVVSKLETVRPLALASNLPADMQLALEYSDNYPGLFAEAFGDSQITPARIAMAIATYERTLVPDQTPWDAFVSGNRAAMTPSQVAGWQAFRDSPCIGCHRPPLFTDNSFESIGLRPVADDPGRSEVSGRFRDRGRFRVPSLRNNGLRASLTHVGWISGLEDILDFYNAGTHDNGHLIFTDNLSALKGRQFGGSGLLVNDIDFAGTEGVQRDEVLDFLGNALTDPRVANESFPFDRPVLSGERR